MKKIIPAFFRLIAISGSVMIHQLLPVSAMPIAKTTNFTLQPPIGELGHPLGKVTTISGVIRQVALGAKVSNFDLVLSIEAVNNRPLPKPVTMPFYMFETAKVVQPVLGQAFRYLGYETGGFTGVPSAAFKLVPAVATTEYHFESVYQVLHEDLGQVKTKADLIQSNDQRVQVIGKYIATSQQPPLQGNENVVAPNTGKPILQRNYATVNIELADGTLVPLYSPLNKLSNRPPQEIKEFDGELVSIIGSLAIQPISTRSKPEASILILRMDRIEFYPAR